MEVMELDLTPFICEAFASNKSVHKLIEDIYEENRVEYYQLAKSSPWYNHEIITSQSIIKEIVMKRSLGILAKGDNEEILKIVIKGWKQTYNIVIQQNIIRVNEVMLRLLPVEEKQQLDKLTSDRFNSYAIIPVALGNLLDKRIDITDDMYDVVMNNCGVRLKLANNEHRFSLDALASEDRKKVRVFKNSIYAETEINRFWASHAASASEDLFNFSMGLSYLFDTENLSISIIEEESLSEKDIEEILAAYFVTAGNRNRTEGGKFLAAGHIVKALLRAYRRLKEEHFKTNKETLYLELDTALHQANEARLESNNLQWIIEEKNKEIENLRKQVSAEYGRAAAVFKDELKTVRKENSELQQKLDQMMIDLKEYEKIIFAKQEPVEIVDIDLSSIRGVIVGGHETWHSKMKAVLPDNWRFIHPDDNYDLNVIANAEIVFFYVGYLNHVIFTDVIAETRRRNIPVGYLKQINEQECLKDILKMTSGYQKSL